MLAKIRGAMAVTVAVSVGSTALLAAADLNTSLMEADGRRNLAEKSLRQIKAKSKEHAEEVRPPYAEVASRHNAWLDAVCQAIQQGATSAPDVTGTAEPAASAFVAWVSARNHALGDPELAPAIAEVVQKSVVQDLIEIANGSWKGNRGDTEETRTKAAIKLKERLQWRGWEEIQ